jgi:hypothetical protein
MGGIQSIYSTNGVVTRYTDDSFRPIPLIAGTRHQEKGNGGRLNADEGERLTLAVEKGQKADDPT